MPALAGGWAPGEGVEGVGFQEPERALHLLRELAQVPGFPPPLHPFRRRLLAALAGSPDADRALANFERLLREVEGPQRLLRRLARKGDLLAALITLCGASQLLTDTLLRHPENLPWLFRPSVLGRPRGRAEMARELARSLRAAPDTPSALEAVRRFKGREYLRIGLRDLLRKADLAETTRALSDLADLCLEALWPLLYRDLVKVHGRPRFRDSSGASRPCGFAILALGKLGGRELNFSSDIDLLYLYSSDEGKTSGAAAGRGGGRRGQVTNHLFYTRLAQQLTEAMTEPTGEGHIFRVDLRLRPEGRSGDLVYSLRSYEIYYESWGETWERQALIKARPAAGDRELGRRFVETVRPFVYRRTLDLGALDEVRAMKDRINRSLAARGDGERDVKRGGGGIREVEFIVQALQLINGGREPVLQRPGTLEAIRALEMLGLLPTWECAALREAYAFLRDLEHRLQIVHGRQTHSLPEDPRALRVLVRMMGFAGGEDGGVGAFRGALERHQAQVSRVFEGLFRRPPRSRSTDPESVHRPGVGPPTGSRSTTRLSSPKSDPESVHRPGGGGGPLSSPTLGDALSPEELGRHNFRDPLRASEHLRLLRNGAPFAHVSARSKTLFDALLPRFLELSWRLADPDMAVVNWQRFVEGAGGRDALFSLLAEHPRIFEVLMHLFATSEHLSGVLFRQPELLDGLLRPEPLTRSPAPGELRDQVARVLSEPRSREGSLRALWRFKQAEELAIGLRSILGEADVVATMDDLTRLAEVCLEGLLGLGVRELGRRFGEPRGEGEGGPAQFAVIGLGKLGSRELNYGSDLDLLFIFSGPGSTSGRWGGAPAREGPLPNYEFFARLAGWLVDAAEGAEAAGAGYRVDLRLRPEGRKGPLVLPLGELEPFYRERAETWQRQMLVRARPVAGSAELGEAFMEVTRGYVYGSPLAGETAAAIDHMRGRMERELARESGGHRDVKLGRGGIADIEFAIQYLQLRFGPAHPEVREPHTLGALRALRSLGLLPVEDARTFEEAYLFLRLLENRLRIGSNRPLHAFPEEPGAIESLALQMGYRDDREGSARAKLLADYERHTSAVREAYGRVFGRLP